MFTLINADADEDDAEITDPEEVAELFAAVAEVAIEVLGKVDVLTLLEAVIERQGQEPN